MKHLLIVMTQVIIFSVLIAVAYALPTNYVPGPVSYTSNLVPVYEVVSNI